MTEMGGAFGNLAVGAQLGLLLGVLSVLLGFWLRKKKDDREGWGALITALQNDILAVRQQHQRCEERLTEVEAQLRGVHRQLVMHSGNTAISLGSPSDHVAAAAKRAVDIVNRDDAAE